MPDTVVEGLIVDLLLYLAHRDRTYAEAIEAWRTSCPKLPVWEDAVDRGLIRQEDINGTAIMKVTPSGFALLERRKLQA